MKIHSWLLCAGLLACGSKASSTTPTTGTTGGSTAGSTTGSTSGPVTCGAGYTGTEPDCVDIDECANSTACSGGKLCTNTVGSFTCACPADRIEALAGECIKMEIGTYSQAVVLRGDGSLWGWGNNEYSQLLGTDAFVAAHRLDDQTYVDFSSRGQTTCGVRSDGKLFCWGYNSNGQAGLATGYRLETANEIPGGPWAHVFTSYYTTCALKTDSSLWCWGANETGALGQGTADSDVHDEPVRVGEGTWLTAALADRTTCAIDLQGALYCWGNYEEDVGRPGDPLAIGLVDPGPFVSVTRHASGTCARKVDQSLWCWGYGNALPLGADFNRPTRLGDDTWAWIDLQVSGGCGRSTLGGVQCFGRIGEWTVPGVRTSRLLEPATLSPVTGSWRYYTTNENFGCGVRDSDGAIVCHGERTSGGTNTHVEYLVAEPRRVESDATFRRVFAGNGGICAVTEAGDEVHCFGDNLGNRFLQADDRFADHPVKVLQNVDITSVAIGNAMYVGLGDGTVLAWGKQAWVEGAAGSGTWVEQATPTVIPSLNSVSEVFASSLLFGALRTSASSLVLGGSNQSGSLGRNLAASAALYPLLRTDMIDITTATWLSAAMGGRTLCAVRRTTGGDQNLHCWGANGSKQAGNDNTADIIAASDGAIGTDHDWERVWTSGDTTCATRGVTRALYCFGSNTFGTLGNGTHNSTKVATPTANSVVTEHVAIATHHVCAIDKVSQRLLCWGNNFKGGLGPIGTNTSSFSDTPAQLSPEAWLDVATSGFATCAIRASDHGLFCWGTIDAVGSGEAHDEAGSVVLP